FVQVRLVLSTIKDAVLIPASASQIGQQGPFVLVVKDDSIAEQRSVTLGQRQGDLIVVQRGLYAGEQVVIEGQISVKPGEKVQVAQPAKTPVAAGAGDG